jgi:hypothetical protein
VIKVGDRFARSHDDGVVRVTDASNPKRIYVVWEKGPYAKGRADSADTETLLRWDRIDPAPVTVRPGQAWRFDGMPGNTYTVLGRHATLDSWTMRATCDSGGTYETHNTLPHPRWTLISDAPEPAAIEVKGTLRLKVTGTDAYTLATDPKVFKGPIQSGPVISINPNSPACDRAIAAKMQAHNDAYAERHKEEIKRAWASMGSYSPPDHGNCRWQRRR